MRCSVSPARRAFFVCMSMQYAQPFICEARILTSSNSGRSRLASASLDSWSIARPTPDCRYLVTSSRGFMCQSPLFPYSEDGRAGQV